MPKKAISVICVGWLGSPRLTLHQIELRFSLGSPKHPTCKLILNSGSFHFQLRFIFSVMSAFEW